MSNKLQGISGENHLRVSGDKTGEAKKLMVSGVVLHDVKLEVAAGEITAIVGPDGAGKTTLMRMVCGLLPLGEGSHLQVAGMDVAREPQRVQSLISYLPQKFGLYEDLTVQENIDLYADLHGVPQDTREKRVGKLLAMTEMSRFADRLAGRLSGGMKQKLGLICTLVRSPELLLLDEPSVGVDPLSRRELWEILLQLVQEERLTVLVNTAYAEEAERCQLVYMLDKGRLLARGTPAELQEDWPRGLKGMNGPGAREPAEKAAGEEQGHSLPAPAEMTEADEGGSRKADIVVHDLVRKFGDFTAVSHTSFKVYRGEVFGMLGPNGAGKTTTFRMLCGLLPATSGELFVGGVDVRRHRNKAREGIGYVAQKFSLYGNLTVQENLRFYGGVYGLYGKALARRIDEAVAEFGLSEKLHQAADSLPLGYKQRLSMAAALFAIVVPGDFASKMAAGEGEVQVLLNGGEAITAMSAQRYIESAVLTWAANNALSASSTAAVGQATVVSRVWFNDANTSTWFFVPGILMMVMTLCGVFLTAVVMAREWERGTLEAIFVTPASLLEIVLSKIIPYFCVAFIGFCLCLVVGRVLYDLPMRGSLAVILLASMLYIIVALGLGLTISAVTKNQFLACQVSMLVSFLPSMMLSGFLFDLHSEPLAIQAISQIFPATHYLQLIKSLFLAGNYWPLIVEKCLLLAGYGVLFIGLAFRLTKRRVG